MNKKKNKNKLIKRIILGVCACFVAVFSVFSLTDISIKDTKKVAAAEYGDTMYQSSDIVLCNSTFNKSDFALYSVMDYGFTSFNFRLSYLGPTQVGVYMYSVHTFSGSGAVTNDCVYYDYAGNNVSNVSSILKSSGMFGSPTTYYSAASQFRVVDNTFNESLCQVVGVTGNKDASKSFSPFYTKFDIIPINTLVARTYNNNQPFYSDIISVLTNYSAYLQVVSFSTYFIEGDYISFYFVLPSAYSIDTNPSYFYSTDGSEEYQDGYDVGYNLGYNTGYDEGYNTGYDEGDTDGWLSGYDEGLQTGLNSTTNTAYNEGYNVGKNEGYNLGYNTAIENDDRYSFTHLITAVIDVPINSFTSLFSFDILGVNMAGFFLGLMTLSVIVAIIKLIL